MRRSGIIAAVWLALAIAPAFADPFPWGPKDEPPVVAGIRLGDSEQHALDVLGAPDDVNTSALGDMLEYNTRGLEVTASKEGVLAIRLFKPEAGAIGELKVGDMARDVITKWGVPQGGEDRVARFGAGEWVILVRLADKEPTVSELILASIRAQPRPQDSQLNVFQAQ